MCQPPLSQTYDGTYALLPMVPDQSAETLETPKQQKVLSCLQGRHRQRVLEFLCLVPGTDSPQKLLTRTIDDDVESCDKNS